MMGMCHVGGNISNGVFAESNECPPPNPYPNPLLGQEWCEGKVSLAAGFGYVLDDYDFTLKGGNNN